MVIRDDFVVTSPFPDIRVPDNVDMASYLTRNFHNYPDRIALIDANTRQSFTFAEVEDLVDTIAANLVNHGFDTSKPLTIFMTNSLEYILLSLAAWRLGGVVACINAMLREGEVRAELEMLKAETLVCDSSTADTALKAIKGTTVKRIFCKISNPGCLPLSSLLATPVDTSRLPSHLHVNQRKDPCMILFSSGTTGLPKGVLLSHRSLIVSCRLFGGPEVDKLSKHHGIVYQPLSHVYGIALTMTHLYWGVTCIIMPKFDLEQYIKLIAEFKVDQIHVVPPIMVMLANSELPRQHDLSCLRSISSGAAPLSQELEQRVGSVVGKHCQIRQSWGMTESCSGLSTTPSFKVCHQLGLSVPQGSIGMLFPNTRMKASIRNSKMAALIGVIDLQTGKALGPNKRGEICAQSDQLMIGYLDNTEATERALDAEGWLHTGDIGYYNTEGCFFVVDRLKELIKYKGYQNAEMTIYQSHDDSEDGPFHCTVAKPFLGNTHDNFLPFQSIRDNGKMINMVAPAELEAVLLSHPAVGDAGVVGLQDTAAGEVPFAWVVTAPGATLTDVELQEFINGKVAPYKRLRGGIKFVDNIPKSPSGKILRREILKMELQSRNIKSKL